MKKPKNVGLRPILEKAPPLVSDRAKTRGGGFSLRGGFSLGTPLIAPDWGPKTCSF